MSRLRPALFGLALFAGLIQLRAGWPSPDRLWDLACFLASGYAVRAGEDPYVIYVVASNGNPPVSLPVFAALSYLEPAEVQVLLAALGLLVYAGVLAAFGRDALKLGWAVAFPALSLTIAEGQIYLVLLAPVAVAWWALGHKRELVAGVCIGLVVAFKPTMIVWPVLLYLAGRRQAAIWSAVSAAALSLVPALAYGPSVYLRWLAASAVVTRGASEYLMPQSASVVTLFAALGVAPLGVILAAAILIGSAWQVWRWRPDPLTTSALGLVVGILASPVSWVNYGVWLVPALLALRWSRWTLAGAVLLLVPPPLVGPVLGLRSLGQAGYDLAGVPVWVVLSGYSVYVWAVVLLGLGWMWQARGLAGPTAYSWLGILRLGIRPVQLLHFRAWKRCSSGGAESAPLTDSASYPQSVDQTGRGSPMSRGSR